jgi:hypothetical protein
LEAEFDLGLQLLGCLATTVIARPEILVSKFCTVAINDDNDERVGFLAAVNRNVLSEKSSQRPCKAESLLESNKNKGARYKEPTPQVVWMSSDR